MLGQRLTTVIPGRAERREPGIQMPILGSRLDSGFGAARRPGMTEWDRIQKSVELKGVNHGFA
jgi:hypothetical protein